MKFKEVAKKAITEYDLIVTSLEFLTEETNIFYLVKTDEGKKYVLKIFQEESSNINDNLAEHYFLNIIANETDIISPSVIPNKKGETVTKIKYSNKRGYKRTALYEYVSGESIYGKEDMGYFRKIGEMMAKMHLATHDLVLPDYVNPKKWGKIFYYENEEAIYRNKQYKKFVTQEMIEILDELIPYIDTKLKDFYQKAKPQLIHADLNPWNIKSSGDKYVVYDFEEAMLGLPIHDIAVFMYYYTNHETLDCFKIKKALIAGYESVSKKPLIINEKDLELIMMARRINFFNYVLFLRKDSSDYINLSFLRIKEYYLSYK
ncbi:phosphotransferase [Mycoplasmatota bacterium WC30]